METQTPRSTEPTSQDFAHATSQLVTVMGNAEPESATSTDPSVQLAVVSHAVSPDPEPDPYDLHKDRRPLPETYLDIRIELDEIRDRIIKVPELGVQLLGMLEPHIDDYREDAELADVTDCPLAIMPPNLDGPHHADELKCTTPRIRIRAMMNTITYDYERLLQVMQRGEPVSAEKLRKYYYAMATIRGMDEVVNHKSRKRKQPKVPKPLDPTAPRKPRGGTRVGAGRPKGTLRPRISKNWRDLSPQDEAENQPQNPPGNNQTTPPACPD